MGLNRKYLVFFTLNPKITNKKEKNTISPGLNLLTNIITMENITKKLKFNSGKYITVSGGTIRQKTGCIFQTSMSLFTYSFQFLR